MPDTDRMLHPGRTSAERGSSRRTVDGVLCRLRGLIGRFSALLGQPMRLACTLLHRRPSTLGTLLEQFLRHAAERLGLLLKRSVALAHIRALDLHRLFRCARAGQLLRVIQGSAHVLLGVVKTASGHGLHAGAGQFDRPSRRFSAALGGLHEAVECFARLRDVALSKITHLRRDPEARQVGHSGYLLGRISPLRLVHRIVMCGRMPQQQGRTPVLLFGPALSEQQS